MKRHIISLLFQFQIYLELNKSYTTSPNKASTLYLLSMLESSDRVSYPLGPFVIAVNAYEFVTVVNAQNLEEAQTRKSTKEGRPCGMISFAQHVDGLPWKARQLG